MITDVERKLVEIFCSLDDFFLIYGPELEKRRLAETPRKLNRQPQMCHSEIASIVMMFHLCGYKDFKHYYTHCVLAQWRGYFPRLHSYNRFVERMSELIVPLGHYLIVSAQNKCTGVSFVDSTTLSVCHKRRIHNHKVFKDKAQRGRSSVDWFFGFKLHLIINEMGDILSFAFTPGNVHDANPGLMSKLTKGLWGKLFGDKGYLSQKLFDGLFANGLQLVTKLKSNMKNRLMPLMDKLLLRKRAIIECVNDELKNNCMIEHTRHRKPENFIVNLFAGLAAYAFLPKKPCINFTRNQRNVINTKMIG